MCALQQYTHNNLCIVVLHTLDTGLLARSQYPEGPATDHLGKGFNFFGFPVPISECSNLLLHASHVALQTQIS